MNSRRLLGIAALGAAAASMVMVPGAGAQEGTYSASSSGRALALNVGPEGVTLGDTSAVIDSTPLAQADGAGVANPLSPVGISTAKVEGADGTAGSVDETCEGELPEIPLLAAAFACSSSVASITGGTPAAASTARVGTLEANPIDPLLDTPLADVLGEVEGVLDQVIEGLSPILGPIDENTDLGLQNTLNELFEQLFDGAPLLTVTIGDTSSSATVEDGKVITTCTANGARIDLLDAPEILDTGIDPEPVLSLIVGEANTTVTADTATGTAEGVSNPSIVTILLPTSPALDGTQVGPGETVEIPLPEPLGTQVISVAGPTTGTTDDGQTFARASAVRIHLLPTETFQGGIELALADCQSFGGANVALPRPPETTTTTQPPLLPRTGSDGPNGLALASAVGFAGLGLVLLRRTRTTV